MTDFRVVPPAELRKERRPLRHNSQVKASRLHFFVGLNTFKRKSWEKPCQAAGLKDGDPGRCLLRVQDVQGPSRSPTTTRLTGNVQCLLTILENKLSSHRWTHSRHTATRGAELDPRLV